jgi:hypothetical protein
MNITEKQIRGLEHRSSTPYPTDEDGQLKTRYTVNIRPLTPEDILGTRETAEGISFVTTDGKKYFWDRKTGKSTETTN